MMLSNQKSTTPDAGTNKVKRRVLLERTPDSDNPSLLQTRKTFPLVSKVEEESGDKSAPENVLEEEPESIEKGTTVLQIRIYATPALLTKVGVPMTCPYPNCNRTLPPKYPFARHMKTHFQNTSDGGTSDFILSYFCPVESCPHSLQKGKNGGFKALKYLRQHFRKVHSQKEFRCKKCKKSFGTRTYLRIHERMCGISFQCSCPLSFSSLESLQTHGRRSGHFFDLEKYKRTINEAKKKEEGPVKPVPRSKCAPTGARTIPHHQRQLAPKANYLPCLIMDESKVTRILLLVSKPGNSVDFGTQTTPLLNRKRSATQHCQTESKMLKTTGTLTTSLPSASASGAQFSKPLNRKTSAQTQTKRIKISAETQTHVVVKRKRCTKKKQITTATTQTIPFKMAAFVRFRDPVLMRPNLAVSPPPLVIDESFDLDEFQSQTCQTDPNPFFGYSLSAQDSPQYVFLSDDSETEDDSRVEPFQKLKTIQTQTSPVTKKLQSKHDVTRFEPKGINWKRNLTGSPAQSNLELENYMEIMDNETQTPFFNLLE